MMVRLYEEDPMASEPTKAPDPEGEQEYSRESR